MRQHSAAVQSLEDLQGFLDSPAVREAIDHAEAYPSVLAMIFTARLDADWLLALSRALRQRCPQARVVGATTTGEIDNGRSVVGQTVVTLCGFESTAIAVFDGPVGEQADAAQAAGLHLREQVDHCAPAAVLVLHTPLTSPVSAMMEGFAQRAYDFHIFGGGAGDYQMEHSLLLCDDRLYRAGAIAVAFSGDRLQVHKERFLGWQPMSPPMTITAAEGQRVLRIDDAPAVQVYQHYLDIHDSDANFFSVTLGFPMLFEHQGGALARVPVSVGPEGALEFINAMHPGDRFRLGFVSPQAIRASIQAMTQALRRFSPEAIWLFTCGCRRFALQGDIQDETQPFAQIAPVAGFYTVGELCNVGRDIPLLNLAFVAIGLREGPAPHCDSIPATTTAARNEADKYGGSHTTVIQRLLFFIGRLNEELEATNRHLEAQNTELQRLSSTDVLTGLHNRASLERHLHSIIELSQRTGMPLSLILIDLDHFKRINDTHGHLQGDEVLRTVARLLRETVRKTDIPGRWGGEEFMLICPDTDLDSTLHLAEKIRDRIARHPFSIGPCTASLGVGTYRQEDDVDALISRSDHALYASKAAGRNKVSREAH